MQSAGLTAKLNRSQRELASMVGPGDLAAGLGSDVPSDMVAKIFEQFAGSAIEVDWMPRQDAAHIFPGRQVAPANEVVYGHEISLARACCVRDVTLIMIPAALAIFARAAIPLLDVKHFKPGSNEARELGWITRMAAKPHITGVVPRLAKNG